MKTKNMEAIKALLDVAVNEGNNLKSCWRDVLMCVSQLERMQLISGKPDAPDKRRYVR
jgi:brefeldin A-inhibited guanine nucleotide-exchange protein